MTELRLGTRLILCAATTLHSFSPRAAPEAGVLSVHQ